MQMGEWKSAALYAQMKRLSNFNREQRLKSYNSRYYFAELTFRGKPIMNSWKIESNSYKQRALAFASFAVGFVFVSLVMFYTSSPLIFNFDSDNTLLWAFLLGLILLFSGVYSLLANASRTVTVNPEKRRIVIEDRSRFKQNRNTIGFEQVQEVYVTEQGDTDGGSISYDVMLKLTSGKNISLFGAAFFDGRYDKNMMHNHCRQLRQYLNV